MAFDATNRGGIISSWTHFDQTYMKRWFGGKHSDRLYRSTAEIEEAIDDENDTTMFTDGVNEEGMHVLSMPDIALSPEENEKEIRAIIFPESYQGSSEETKSSQ